MKRRAKPIANCKRSRTVPEAVLRVFEDEHLLPLFLSAGCSLLELSRFAPVSRAWARAASIKREKLALFSYEKVVGKAMGSSLNSFSAPGGVCSLQEFGGVCVADTGNGRLVMLSDTGTPLHCLDVRQNGIRLAHFRSVASNGSLLFAADGSDLLQLDLSEQMHYSADYRSADPESSDYRYCETINTFNPYAHHMNMDWNSSQQIAVVHDRLWLLCRSKRAGAFCYDQSLQIAVFDFDLELQMTITAGLDRLGHGGWAGIACAGDMVYVLCHCQGRTVTTANCGRLCVFDSAGAFLRTIVLSRPQTAKGNRAASRTAFTGISTFERHGKPHLILAEGGKRLFVLNTEGQPLQVIHTPKKFTNVRLGSVCTHGGRAFAVDSRSSRVHVLQAAD